MDLLLIALNILSPIVVSYRSTLLLTLRLLSIVLCSSGSILSLRLLLLVLLVIHKHNHCIGLLVQIHDRFVLVLDLGGVQHLVLEDGIATSDSILISLAIITVLSEDTGSLLFLVLSISQANRGHVLIV